MSELRSAWTAEQAQENFDAANAFLPEAQTTDRFPARGRASGMDVRAGEEPYEEDEAVAAEPGGEFRVPPDPPRGDKNQGGM